MNLVFGRATFDCIKQAERDWAVAGIIGLSSPAEAYRTGYSKGHADGVITGMAGVRPGATQAEWDEAHTINDRLMALDHYFVDARVAVLDGRGVHVDIETDKAERLREVADFFANGLPGVEFVFSEPPRDASAECHDLQFADLSGPCPPDCKYCAEENEVTEEPPAAARLFGDALGLTFIGTCQCGKQVG